MATDYRFSIEPWSTNPVPPERLSVFAARYLAPVYCEDTAGPAAGVLTEAFGRLLEQLVDGGKLSVEEAVQVVSPGLNVEISTVRPRQVMP